MGAAPSVHSRCRVRRIKAGQRTWMEPRAPGPKEEKGEDGHGGYCSGVQGQQATQQQQTSNRAPAARALALPRPVPLHSTYINAHGGQDPEAHHGTTGGSDGADGGGGGRGWQPPAGGEGGPPPPRWRPSVGCGRRRHAGSWRRRQQRRRRRRRRQPCPPSRRRPGREIHEEGMVSPDAVFGVPHAGQGSAPLHPPAGVAVEGPGGRWQRRRAPPPAAPSRPPLRVPQRARPGGGGGHPDPAVPVPARARLRRPGSCSPDAVHGDEPRDLHRSVRRHRLRGGLRGGGGGVPDGPAERGRRGAVRPGEAEEGSWQGRVAVSGRLLMI